MTSHREISVLVNDESVVHLVPTRKNLVDFLREDLELTGSHVGCEHGVCGACTVRLDGKIVRGCLLLAVQADGCRLQTIEGVTKTREIEDLQEAFVRRNATQCGYCTPGMLMTCADLLAAGQPMGRDEIREYLSGNFCRCTGYHAIVDAVSEVLTGRNETGQS